jgi:hypothetical protein
MEIWVYSARAPVARTVPSSHDPQDQAFQVVGLGHGEQNGMVARLRPALHHHDRPVGVECRRGNDFEQVSLADMERAGAGDEVSARVQDFQGPQVQLFVAAQS